MIVLLTKSCSNSLNGTKTRCVSHRTVIRVYRDGPGWPALCNSTFSLWFTKVLASLMCRYGQKVTLVKKIFLGKVLNSK